MIRNILMASLDGVYRHRITIILMAEALKRFDARLPDSLFRRLPLFFRLILLFYYYYYFFIFVPLAARDV